MAQISFGLLLGLLLMEVVLQIGSRFTVPLRGGQHQGVIGDGRRLAFFGDSNTFGLGAGHQNSYPLVLARRWKSDPATQQLEVLNLGMPGLNSSRLRQQFRGMLATLRPDVVTIMIGVNDLWTVPVPLYGQEENWHYRLWSASRAYRFLYMLSKTWENPRRRVDLEYTPAGLVMRVANDVGLTWTAPTETGEPQWGWLLELRQNLQAIIADARTVGVEPVVLTYPSDRASYGEVNRALREIAAITQTRVIDLASVFLEACPSRQCPDLFLPDQHPTAAGHRLAAEVLWQEFSSLSSLHSPVPTPGGSTGSASAAP